MEKQFQARVVNLHLTLILCTVVGLTLFFYRVLRLCLSVDSPTKVQEVVQFS
jgi:hypothetical protein